jgi:hypothetical protein
MYLSKQSKELMTFLSKNKHVFYENITNKSKSLLKEIYDVLVDADKIEPQYTIAVKKIAHSSQIIKPSNFGANSFPKIIIGHINEYMMTEISFTFSLYDRNVKVYFVVEKDAKDLNIDLYKRYMKSITMWIYVLNIYSSKKCARNINIYFYFTSLKKSLPTSNSNILDETNVNTAFTTTCPKDSEIVVFRKEEWFKVFIHETFHNFGLDFSMMNNDTINKCILSIFKVESYVNSYESYTEFWAEIINAAFCSFHTNKNDVDDFLINIEMYINFERTYSFFQLVKTLEFMGLTYNDLYSNSKHSSMLREKLYKEKTSVLSYYIIKCVLMNNYQGFLQWCSKNNSPLLQFTPTVENQDKFCEFIEKNYKTRSMLYGVHETDLFLSKLRKKKGNKYLLNNMRMTICELG